MNKQHVGFRKRRSESGYVCDIAAKQALQGLTLSVKVTKSDQTSFALGNVNPVQKSICKISRDFRRIESFSVLEHRLLIRKIN